MRNRASIQQDSQCRRPGGTGGRRAAPGPYFVNFIKKFLKNLHNVKICLIFAAKF